jgi:hypothetical protein
MLKITVQADGTMDVVEDTALSEPTLTASTSVVLPVECSQTAYKSWDVKVINYWPWFMGDGDRPPGMTTANVVSAFNGALGRITSSTNDCGLADEVDVSYRYDGATTKETDMHLDATGETVCGDGSFDGRDGTSTVDFKAIEPSSTVASMCHWDYPIPFANDDLVEADVRFDYASSSPSTSHAFTLDSGPTCSGKWDLEGVATHEFGHVYGFGHVSEATYPRMTMSPDVAACEGQLKQLGRGDVLGLRSKY